MRNGYEKRVAAQLGPDYEYEAIKLPYVTKHTYTPDFVDVEHKRIVEAKGYFRPSDRAKMKAVRAAHPQYHIEIWFTNPNKTISKSSTTTYAQWCQKNGIIAKQGPMPVRKKACRKKSKA